MLLAVILIGVAAAFLLGRPTRPPEHEGEHGEGAGGHEPTGASPNDHGVPSGGSIGDVVGAIGGVAGSAVTLGGTIVAAVGGGGTAAGAAGAGATAVGAGGATTGGVASGGTIAAGTGGTVGGTAGSTAGGTVVAGSGAGAGGYVVSGGAFASVSGVTTGAPALGVALLFYAPAIIAVVLAQAAEFAGAQRLIWSELSSNKRRLYFSRWFAFEEWAVQKYLLDLAAKRGTNVAYTKRPVQYIDDADIGGFAIYNSVVDTVDDAEAAAAIPQVRAIARWAGIYMWSYYNRAVAAYWQSLGEVSPAGTYSPFTWAVHDPYGVVDRSAGAFNQGGTPGMFPADYWKLAEQYIAQQPFARTNSPSEAGGKPWSWQPLGALPYVSYTQLSSRAAELLGTASAQVARDLYLLGLFKGGTLATSKDYQLAWPGEGEYTRAIGIRCAMLTEPGTQQTGNFVLQYIVNSANKWRTVIRETQGGLAWDVTESRQNKGVVLYPASTIQRVSVP